LSVALHNLKLYDTDGELNDAAHCIADVLEGTAVLLTCLEIVGLALLLLLGLCTVAACLANGQAERRWELARELALSSPERPAHDMWPQQRTAGDDATPAGRRVLVVDDDAQLRPVLQQLMAALDYEADVAASGQEALHCLDLRNYDAVLCDLMMPGMSGDELFAACQRQHPETARRFIFITAYPPGTPSVDSAANSGQPFLAKPCRVAEISVALEQVA